MIVLHRADGTSPQVASADGFEPTAEWTGALVKGAVDLSVAAPKGLGNATISVDPCYEGNARVGDRVTIQADRVRLDILVYANQNRVRVVLRRTGKVVWTPAERGR